MARATSGGWRPVAMNGSGNEGAMCPEAGKQNRIFEALMNDEKQYLPRGPAERLGFGCISLLATIWCGLSALAILIAPLPPLGMLFRSIVIVTQELLIAATLFFVLCLIWAVAMPTWVENLFASVRRKLLFAILLSTVPLIILIVLASFGMKVFK